MRAAEHPGDVWLEHHAVLAFARAGSTGEAARSFAVHRVDAEEVATLRARLEKEVALAAGGKRRAEHAGRSAALYDAVFARTRGTLLALAVAVAAGACGGGEDSHIDRRPAGPDRSHDGHPNPPSADAAAKSGRAARRAN